MTDNVVRIARRWPKAWQDDCQQGAGGSLKSNVHNAMIALRRDPDVRDVYAFDEMLRAPVVLHEIAQLETCHRLATDTDVIGLQIWLQHEGMTAMGIETARTALQKRAEECAFHPVRQYLNALIWDGTPRIGVWLPRYLGSPFNAYTQHIGRMFMVQMIARVASPGCQADHMLVLEGAQGVLKSTACRVLGGDWYSDHLPEISAQREASQHLRGKWVIEVAEMHAMNRAEATMLKSFITRTTERYRPYWGRAEVLEPRQCVFIGTTNQDEYLRDPTGGRRFWPVRTALDAPIDIARLTDDRDQLLAEALQAYRDGDQWWPDQQFEREFITPEQGQRFQGDIWEDRIAEHVAGRSRCTIAEIAAQALSIPAGQMTPQHAGRIGAILRERGWTAKRSRHDRWWELIVL